MASIEKLDYSESAQQGLPSARVSPRLDNYLRPPALLSVEVADGEEVEWIWTHYADGRSMPTGYRITSRLDRLLTR